MTRKVVLVEFVEAKGRNGKRYTTFQNKRKRSPIAPIKRRSPPKSSSKEDPFDFSNDQGPDMGPSTSNKKAKTKKTSGRVRLVICSWLAPTYLFFS
jgi:hypothetical protein